jgi:hypothetical protein
MLYHIASTLPKNGTSPWNFDVKNTHTSSSFSEAGRQIFNSELGITTPEERILEELNPFLCRVRHAQKSASRVPWSRTRRSP